MKCPNCSHEFGVPEGVTLKAQGSVTSSSDLRSDLNLNPQSSLLSETRTRVRGPNKDYSAAFEAAWVQYGRKQEKEESFFRWRIVAPTVGGEEPLLRLCLAAFRWQAIDWGPEGWKFAPYFHRYLKKRKFEDEPLRAPSAPIRPVDDRGSRAVDARVADLERYKKPDPRITAELRALSDAKKAAGNG